MEKQFYISKEQFVALQAAWKSIKTHTAAEHILYNILRSKPADLGFTQRTNNIQGDDPWFGFNTALKEARRMCDTSNPWEKYKDTAYNSSYVGGMKRIIENKQRFMNTFGIDMPEDIMTRLSGV